MTRIIIIFTLLLSACNEHSTNTGSQFGYAFSKELKYKIGDCLYFKSSDSTYGCVVVCDFSKDEGGIWYGAFYSAYDSTLIPTIQSIGEGKVMGRKVQSFLNTKGYEECLDGDFIIDTLFTNTSLFTPIGNIELKGDIHLGSNGAATTLADLRRSFHRGREFRMKPPDNYKDHLTKLDNFHPEEYFEMKDFAR